MNFKREKSNSAENISFKKNYYTQEEFPKILRKIQEIIFRRDGKRYKNVSVNRKPIFPKGNKLVTLRLGETRLYFYNQKKSPLKKIYPKISSRLEYSVLVYDYLTHIRQYPLGSQCIIDLLSTIPCYKNNVLTQIGKGDYGNVYKFDSEYVKFAVKVSRIKDGAMNEPFSSNYSSWHETTIMKKIFREILRKGLCPNLPYIYDSFYCTSCKLNLSGKDKYHPCAISVNELGDGTLRDYLENKENKLNNDELCSALFQIMAGLHAIQKYGQVLNYDIKSSNILYYNLELPEEAHYVYVIHGKRFYVPIYKLFVLNDFGISRSMSPEWEMYSNNEELFRLGHRYGIIIDGKITPLKTLKDLSSGGKLVNAKKIKLDGVKTTGGHFRVKKGDDSVLDISCKLDRRQISFLEEKGLCKDPRNKDFFRNPEIIPPFEFYNDTQDVIRMFTGGKRTTQNGNHKKRAPDDFCNKLRPYLGKGDCMKDGEFSSDPCELLSGYFICSFFSDVCDYTKRLSTRRLGKFEISTDSF